MTQTYPGSYGEAAGTETRRYPAPDETQVMAVGKRRADRANLDFIEGLAHFLDSAIRIPGTRFRIGADSIVGLIPGVGDVLTTGLSAWIVYEAHRIGVPRRLLARMIGNVAVDAVVGSIPLAGDVFDAVWKANRRNLMLLHTHLDQPPHANS